eukprot:11436606-Prorocentrum_lima.AAC.1
MVVTCCATSKGTHQSWIEVSSREKAILEAKIALVQPFPTPPLAHQLKSILRVDLCELSPRHI